MNNIKKEYSEVLNERKSVLGEISELSQDEKVKKYLNLISKNNELKIQQKELYRKMKNEEYSKCKHIWVTSKYDYDSFEGRGYSYCGCIKCGLDRSVFYTISKVHHLDFLTYEERIMYEFFKNNTVSTNEKGILCDLELAKAIYKKIKEQHPNIKDKQAMKFLNSAIYNIRKNKVNEERKESRAKRLSLKPNFDKWNQNDIII